MRASKCQDQQQSCGGHCDHEPGKSTSDGQHDAFDERLSNNLAAAGTDCDP